MIPYRLFYSVPEAAQYLSVTPEYLYKAIAKGERETPPPDAILPGMVRRLGAKICISRRYLYPNEPDNVFQFPQAITDTDVERIAKRTSELVLESMYLAFRKVG